MRTEIYHIDPHNPSPVVIEYAAKLIKNGEVVAFPTETVYGLGADATNANAVKKIFEAKGRPSDNPLIIHISNYDQIDEIAYVSDEVLNIAKKFWPGPLTIILKRKKKVPAIVTAGLDTVAIRMPRNKIALELIEKAEVPIAAPSANISGRPSGTTADEVYQDFKGKIPLILDGGKTEIGVESTVINLLIDPPVILRPGGVTYEALKKFIPNITVAKQKVEDNEVPLSPGLKYRHYAPKCRLILVIGDPSKQFEYINKECIRLKDRRPYILCLYSEHNHPPSINVIKVGKDFKEIQQNLFSTLRELDKRKVELAFIESVEKKEEGLAIMNRIEKAANEWVFVGNKGNINSLTSKISDSGGKI